MADALHTPGVTSAAEARFDDAGLIAVGAGGLTSARTGVLAGPGSTALVTGTASTAPMRYSVAAHHWVTSRGVVSDGIYRGGAETAQLVDTTAAPGTGSRIDVVWVKQQDATSTISADGTTAPLYGCTQGTSSTGTPSVPAIPTGAEELARVTVTSSATRTDGAGVTIIQTAKQTTARGGVLPVRNQAERDALPIYAGMPPVNRLDTNQIEAYLAGAWQYVAGPPIVTTFPFNSTYQSLAAGSEFATAVLIRHGARRWLRGYATDSAGLSGGAAQNAYTLGTLAAGDRPAGTEKFPMAARVGSSEVAGILLVRQSGVVDYLLLSTAPTAGLTLSLSGANWLVGA